MNLHDGDPTAAKLGITIGIWLLVLLYLLINGIWLGVAAAVIIGIVLLFVARSIVARMTGRL